MTYRRSLLWALVLAPFLAGAAFLLNGAAALSPRADFAVHHRMIDTQDPLQAPGRRYWMRLEPDQRPLSAAPQSIGV